MYDNITFNLIMIYNNIPTSHNTKPTYKWVCMYKKTYIRKEGGAILFLHIHGYVISTLTGDMST
jgi:hypothetical protein